MRRYVRVRKNKSDELSNKPNSVHCELKQKKERKTLKKMCISLVSKLGGQSRPFSFSTFSSSSELSSYPLTLGRVKPCSQSDMEPNVDIYNVTY